MHYAEAGQKDALKSLIDQDEERHDARLCRSIGLSWVSAPTTYVPVSALWPKVLSTQSTPITERS